MSCNCQHLHPNTEIPYPQLLSNDQVVHLLESVDEGLACTARARTQEIALRYISLMSCLASNTAEAHQLIERVFRQSAAGAENGRLFQALLQLGPGLSESQVDQLMGADEAYVHLFYDKQPAQRRTLVDHAHRARSFQQLQRLWRLGRTDLWQKRLVFHLLNGKEGLTTANLKELLEMFPEKRDEIIASCAYDGRLSIVRSMMDLELAWPSREARYLEGLLYAIVRSDADPQELEAIALYLEGVDVSSPVSSRQCGEAPWLVHFAWSGQLELCKFLVRLGADLSLCDQSDRGTLLEHAALQPELWKLLIEAGAAVESKALHRLVHSKSHNTRAAESWKPIIQMMVDRGMDINEKGEGGRQLLIHMTYSSEWIAMLESLGAKRDVSCCVYLCCAC